MIIIRMMIAAIVCLTIIAYLSYVMVTSSPCERIDRATLPVRLATDFTKQAVKPWTQPSTLDKIDGFSARTRLRAALLFRIQFYSDRVPPVICDWDAYKDRILNADSTLEQKDSYNRQHAEESNYANTARGR